MFLIEPLPAILIFIVLYLSDYYLTIYGARLYQGGAGQVIVFEGSYELNPRYVSDVDRLRSFSPRFIGAIILYSLLIWVLWYLSVILLSVPQAFRFAVGGVLLAQGPIHIRHIRNIMAFERAMGQDGVTGRIEYSREFSYTASALELVLFSGVYFILAVMASSWELGGGAFVCFYLGIKHHRLANKAREGMDNNRVNGADLD